MLRSPDHFLSANGQAMHDYAGIVCMFSISQIMPSLVSTSTAVLSVCNSVMVYYMYFPSYKAMFPDKAREPAVSTYITGKYVHAH